MFVLTTDRGPVFSTPGAHTERQGDATSARRRNAPAASSPCLSSTSQCEIRPRHGSHRTIYFSCEARQQTSLATGHHSDCQSARHTEFCRAIRIPSSH